MTLFLSGEKSAPQPRRLERLLAAGTHLSGFVAPFLAPLIIWLITRKRMPYVAQHARHALVAHLLTWLTIGVLGLLAVVVFLLVLGGTISTRPVGDSIRLVYSALVVLLIAAAFLTWVIGQISYIAGAIRALQGKPPQTFRRKRHRRAHQRSV